MISPLQFHFQFEFGYELTTVGSFEAYELVHRQIQKIHPIFDCFDSKKDLAKKLNLCIIQKRFEHNWMKNGHAVMFYFMTLFANLDFLIFIARHCSMLEDMKVIMT